MTDQRPAGTKPASYAFGGRIRTPKPGAGAGCPWRQRGSEKGFRVAFIHPDGSKIEKSLKEEAEMNKTEEAARAAKLKEIEATVEKFEAEHPAEAAEAKAKAEAWIKERQAEAYPFETAVSRLRAAGASLSDAIRKTAAANPSDHDDYLRRAAEGKARDLR